MSLDAAAALTRVGLDPAGVVVDDVAHNRWLTAGIWLVSEGGQRMVLKHLEADRARGDTPWDAHWTAGSSEPRRWNYWAREGLAYADRLPDVFAPAGIVAPVVVALDSTDTDVVLLLEFVDGIPAERWAIPDYAGAATALGRAQAPFLIGQPLPDVPWLSRGFIRDYTSEKPVDWSLLDDDRAWSQPLVQDNFPPELREATVWLHSSREQLLSRLESLPRTLCHLDFWTKNLIRRADGSIVLLDWAFVGDGAIGEDIGNLIPDAAFDHFIPASSLPDLEAAVLAGYIDGLTAAGWSGDPALVELGMCASAVKYDWLTPHMLIAASAERQIRYGGDEEIDADYRFRERGLALLHNAQTARRAVDLAAKLGL